MVEITEATSIEELAVILSEALEAAGIIATLSGGGAVSIYSNNQYMSHDLDFVTSADPKNLLKAIAPLGFAQGSSKRLYEHPRTEWLVEFPAGPLGFGELYVTDPRTIDVFQSEHGALRVITPTLCVIDRLAAYFHHCDRQCWDQAVMVCRSHSIDWDAIADWARNEKPKFEEVERLRVEVDSSS
ncbi:hypothetical protein [Cyanobium sp. ATX 6F1]|uniref:hypothetical protein n=1 Tax=unclassified Cyanobium TaxID=2627006 RepID=UPI0020CD7C5F|nr:hypothetical protein [Cyanobium sp. ATX 6F1]MCP9916254.1 hypothetical protein [Cyanobium sp. ATX 6F1]